MVICSLIPRAYLNSHFLAKIRANCEPKFPVFLITIRAEALNDLGGSVRIERRCHHEYATAALLLRLPQNIA